MGFKLSISISEEPGRIVIQECTGKYSAENKTGYGTPNIKLSNVKTAQFEIYLPGATVPVIYNAFPDYPTDDTQLQYEVLHSALGLNYMVSGVYRVGYRITGENDNGIPFEYYTETKEIFLAHAKCCVDKLMAATANIPANALMKDERKKSAAELSALMRATEWAKCCPSPKYSVAETNLSFINLQCQECCI